jgi:D-alanyl-lipoteichoic acid acyltransferase DltB (MBOAT superfamily)
MLFNSFPFLIFFVLVTGVYFLLPHKYRWVLLLVGSCYFYMSFVPLYILILGFTIVVDYCAGIYIENSQGYKRRIWLVASLAANIGILFVFKYYNFLAHNANSFFKAFIPINQLPYLSILLPIGLSFHTFQAMSYTIEVYRGNQKAERHLGIYSLYVMFYPQLVAGPIERPQNLLHQFREKFDFDYQRVTDGLKLMAWGLFKKVVIADRLAIIVDGIYDDPNQHHGLSYVIATVLFSFQIFCDFSGYTDMARGAAKVMGFHLMKNFNAPYHSKSIQEFWARWHISLSTWFRDYLYIPLGGNRVAVPKMCVNLLVVFVISGVWHGANWTFIFWGLLNGCYLIFALVTRSYREKINTFFKLSTIAPLHNCIQVVTTFAFISFAWIFFRAKSISWAFFIVKSIFTNTFSDVRNLLHHVNNNDLGFTKPALLTAACLIAFLEIVHIVQQKGSIAQLIKKQGHLVKWSIYGVFILLLLTFGVTSNHPFIYFQF